MCIQNIDDYYNTIYEKNIEVKNKKDMEEEINKLKEKDILDDTVIVLSADHYPYGLTNDDINSVTPLEDAKFDIHKNNLIIWSNTMKKNIKMSYS